MMNRFLFLVVVLLACEITVAPQAVRQIPLRGTITAPLIERQFVGGSPAAVILSQESYKRATGQWTKILAEGVVDAAVSREGTIWIAGTDGAVRFSKDGGATWTQITPGGIRRRPQSLSPSYERLSAGTDAKVFAVSTDGGLWKYERNNWTSTRAGGFSDVAVSQTGTVWVAGKDGTISFSNNDGASWTKTDASGFSNISVGNDTQVWAAGANGTVWSYDGQTWKRVIGSNMADVAFSPQGRTWLTGTNGTVWFVDNQGLTNITNASEFGRIAIGADYPAWGVGSNGTLWKLEGTSPESGGRPSWSTNQIGNTVAVSCKQEILSFSIIRRKAGDYQFRFQTSCPTIVTIEFSDAPPVSLNPPQFRKKVYQPGELLVPKLSTGLNGKQSTHSVDADLSQFNNLNYYIVTVWDASGAPTYKTGSMSKESVPGVTIKGTDIQKIIRP